MNQLLLFLIQSPLFHNFSTQEVKMIIPFLKRKDIKKGDFLYYSGDSSSFLYIMLSGKFNILMKDKEFGQYEIKSVILPGDIVGETAVLVQTKRIDTVLAILDSQVLALDKRDFLKIMAMFPKISLNIAKIEATKIHSLLDNDAIPGFRNKIYAHSYVGTDIESSIMGLNLATAMLHKTNHKIAYLHFGSLESAPLNVLNITIPKDKIINSLSELRVYEHEKDKKWLIRHNSGLWLLPIIITFAELLDKEGFISRLLSTLSLSFDYIFVNIGQIKKDSIQQLEIIKQVDTFILGFSAANRDLQSIKETILFLNKKNNINFTDKNYLYVNHLPIKQRSVIDEYDAALLESVFDFLDPQQRIFKNLTNLASFFKLSYIYDRGNISRLTSAIESDLEVSISFSIKGEYFRALSNILLHDKSLFSEKIQPRSYLKSLEFAGRKLTDASIGIALGGGGARSFTALGVLKVLEENNIRPDYISGTSMGALVGASYLIEGCNIEKTEIAFEKWLSHEKQMIDYSFPQQAFFKGKKMERILEGYFKDTLIEDLPIPFACVATDLITGKAKVFTKGLLWQALRASVSLPVVFPPVFYEGTFLIDGAAINNVPGDVIRQQGAKYVIGVNCTPLHDPELGKYLKSLNDMRSNLLTMKGFFKKIRQTSQLFMHSLKRPPILAIANRALVIEGVELLHSKEHSFDYLINIDVSSIGMFDFHRRREIMHYGIEQTEIEIKLIKKSLNLPI